MDVTGPLATINPSDHASTPLNGNTPSGIEPFARELLDALLALRDGRFAVRLPADLTGLNGKIRS